VKLTDPTCACINLPSFDYEVHRMIGNGSQFEYAETCMKKFVKSHQVNLFLAGCSNLKPMCNACPSQQGAGEVKYVFVAVD
jgi:hypothetical protein